MGNKVDMPRRFSAQIGQKLPDLNNSKNAGLYKNKISLLERIYERIPDQLFPDQNFHQQLSRHLQQSGSGPAFVKRDLDSDLMTYMEESSVDIPLKYPLILQFNAPTDIRDSEKEQRVITGIKTYFQFMIRSYKREINQVYQRSITYILSAFALLLFGFYLNNWSSKNILYETLVEGLNIGGWVFLWEAIVLFVFKNRDTRIQCKRYERLENSPIHFVYS
ncbi:MAG: hypothetical protein IPG21_11140 [Saprospiraceae bacterium]|nr:hypothetical protein [Candidatus Vicinibacter affinis]